MPKKKFLTVILLLSICMLLISPRIISCNEITNQKDMKPHSVKNWTFMLYFCADTRDEYVTSNQNNGANCLGKAMLNTLTQLWTQLLQVGSYNTMNVIALFDFPYSDLEPNGHAVLYEVRRDNLIVLDDWGATNMGSGITLTNFINFCKTNYPANKYSLLLSDHGRGYAGFCYDYHAQHPSFEYALGDCLTVEELTSVIDNTGWLDVLFLDTCLGGSFEVMWQLAGKVKYVVAGETIQKYEAMYHPKDLLYNMSRDTDATPYECAYYGFLAGANPVYVPQNPYYTYEWQNIGIYDLDKLNAIVDGAANTLAQTFNQFANYLYSELQYNHTLAKSYFAGIRSKLFYSTTIMSSKSMMVDLGDMITTILENTTYLHYKTEIEDIGAQLLNLITPGPGKYLSDFFVDPSWHNSNITGFTICFPDTLDMYQEYLYPHFYYDLDISTETAWEDFIFGLYDLINPAIFGHIPEYYEIYLGPIDPCIDLHIYIDQLRDPIHIGYTNPTKDTGFDVEVGLESASFTNDMLFGTTTIRIPISSIPAAAKGGGLSDIQIVVNATAAASASKDVNLTIKHVEEGSIVWEDTKISNIEIGQVIGTNVTVDEDEWSEWDELAPPIETPRFNNINYPSVLIIISLNTILILIMNKRREKK